ncbi:MAG: TonB-dependent receptor [Gemmatimonadaceae bacterium]|nr:TonB-dependent receptor [Gemmatimonadaceae bacterium]
MKNILCLSLSVALVTPRILSAQSLDSARLPNVVVSATKAPSDKARLGVPVTIITGAELRAKGITRVVDALREAPGIAIVQNGSAGSISSIFLRGGESRYTKVLLDGVTLNAPGGYIDLSHLTTDNIERIEIVRGPSSVVHGADAVAGVIQIFTKAGGGASRSAVSARTGSLGTREVELSTAGQGGASSYSLGGGFHSTDGIHSFNNEYRNGTISGSFTLPLENVATFRAVTRYTTAEYHYPTDYTGQPVDTNSYRVQHRLVTSLQADRNLTSSIRAVVTAGGNDVRDLTEDIQTPFGSTKRLSMASRSIVFRRFGDARITAPLPNDATLTIGSGYQREREAAANLKGPVAGLKKETDSFRGARTNAAFYGEMLGTALEKLSYNVSGRLDRNSDFGNFVTNSTGISFQALRDTRLRASYGTAFNAPAFSQLRPTLYTVGSPDLDAEESSSWQVGIEQTVTPGVIVGGTLFRQRYTHMIQYVSGGPPTFMGSFANLAAASANGSEVEASVDPSAWNAKLRGVLFRANYSEVRPRVTSLDASYKGSLNAGDALIRRPTHSGNLSASIARRLWDLSAVANYVGKRPDIDFAQFPSPTLTLDPYTRLDLSGSISLQFARTGTWAATFRVENVTDRAYQEVFGFDAPGRIVLVGLRWGSPLK